MLAIPNALFFVLISIFFVVGIKTGGNFRLALRGESPKALAAAPERLVDIFERSVEMYRARAVLVNDNAITIAYARPNKTKGKARFDMDRAFYRVYEGDTGVLVIIDQGVGKPPFYKFINDREIPSIDDVLEIGTGDELTDEIFRSLRESRLNERS